MNIKEKGDFSQGSVSSNVYRLALPIILAELVQVTYNIVDRMYIGHIKNCGTEALTGIGLVLPFITIITAFANLCSYGGATLSAIARGQKDDVKAQKIMENSFTLLCVSGLLLTAFFYFFTSPLVMLFGGDEQTTFYACQYFDIYLTGTVFVLVSLGMNSFINMQGFSVIGMFTVVIGAVLNIILDPVLIFVFDMGIRGAAVATVISQFFSALWVVLFLTKKNIALHISRLYLDKKTTSEIVKLGVSGFLFKATNSIAQAVSNTTLRLFGGPLGTVYIASMSVINSLREIVYQPVMGFIEGAKPVLSYNFGAKKYSRVDKCISFMHRNAFLYCLGVWAVMMFLPKPLIRIFTNDELLIKTCVPCIRTYFCVFFFMSWQTAGQNCFVAMKYSKYSVFFSLLRKVFLIVPLTLILPRIGLGVMGVFWAEAISEIIGGNACHITLYFKVWKPIKEKSSQ
ncbi:MAG: MATE family efflux transporter [Sphaerochaetaceae bacterium]|nr:MATE family efflux transporter [Sphaerochaetaceae bacterium]